MEQITLYYRQGSSDKIYQASIAAQDGGYVVAFVLPATMTADTAPVPTDTHVRVRDVPERVAAAAGYSGRWTQSSYDRHLGKLSDAVVASGFLPVGVPRFARFDPPFKPWFLRHNEVVVDVDEKPGPTALEEERS